MSERSAYFASTSSVAMVLFFGIILFVTAAMTARCYLYGYHRPLMAAASPKATALEGSFSSIYTLLWHSSTFGLILFVAYLSEYHPIFPHSEKSYDRDEFFMLTGLLFFASAFTLKKNGGAKAAVKEESMVKSKDSTDGTNSNNNNTNGSDSSNSQRQLRTVKPASAYNDVLNRDQTEEWKGWMQFMFLLYHYYHAEEVYNSIRIMITCYVWMTGFGNFSFFYLKADYSAVRVLQMLWRLNFLVIFLCLTQGTTYILYYICPLHTFFFLMVYVSMRVGKDLNYKKYGLRIKLLVVAICIFLIWDVDLGLFPLLHFFLGTKSQLGAGSGSLWEWYFRTTLDHWSTFFGMVFAANFPITSLFLRKLEALPNRQEWFAKGIVGAALLFFFYKWVTGPFMLGKLEYNQTNSYFGFVPMITYIYFRNISFQWRSYSLDLLHQIGKTTLETYLMQHHIWLTSNAKSLLTLVPGWPKCNFLVVTIMYFFFSRRLYRLTLFLRGMMLPDDYSKCIKSLLGISFTVGAMYIIAWVLEELELVSLTVLGVLIFCLGGAIFSLIVSFTWNKESKNHQENGRIFSGAPWAASLSLLLTLGLLWHSLALNGAAKIQPLNSLCASYVNDGLWVPISACSEVQRAVGRYEYGVENYALCDGGFSWGWKPVPSNMLCRFTNRNVKSLKQALSGREIHFVGDSNVRKLYYSLNHLMGNQMAGYEDTSVEKHSDIEKEILGSKLKFRWAPLASDEVEILSNVAKMSPNPDLIVVGGGLWDRLHNWGNEKDKSEHQESVKELRDSIKALTRKGISVVWVTPTTINDRALNTEDKRDHMKESNVQEVRDLYADLGIESSSSFVLSGPSYTRDRVLESYDGVHYPRQVYDAGAQILTNAMDWLLPKQTKKISEPPRPGSMAHPGLGLMMVALSAIALFSFDSYFGLSFLAKLVLGQDIKIASSELYEEAFTLLHEKMNLPPVIGSITSSIGGSGDSVEMSGLLRESNPANNASNLA